MEQLQCYASDKSSSESSCELENTKTLDNSDVRSVYLVTYSQADLERAPTRKYFAEIVVESFTQGNAKVKHWCCSQEYHQDGGVHYHLAISLDKCHRWFASKQFLLDRFGIKVNYSSRHHNYHSAWKYVIKSDTEYVESPDHPRLSLTRVPSTNAASQARHRRRSTSRRRADDGCNEDGTDEESAQQTSRASGSNLKKKRKRLTAFEVSEIIIKSGTKTLIELQALAYEQKQEGKTDLAEFLISRTPCAVADILNSAWEIENAQEKLSRANKNRMELLEDAKNGNCREGCNGEWITCARQILYQNGIAENYFSESVKVLLQKGHGKYRNLILTGPSNCGKTFLLNPLRQVYETFCNPETGSFAWVGVERPEFRWSQ